MRFYSPKLTLHPGVAVKNTGGNAVAVVPQPPTAANPAILTEDGKAIQSEDGNAILEK